MRAALLAIAACSSAPAARAPAAAVAARPIDAGVADAEVSPDAGASLALCGRRTWSGCLSAADSLRDDGTRGYDAEAARIYAALCTEGDRRRCFEDDTAAAVRAGCADDGLVIACRALGAMYRDGLATCPSDSACAEDLFAMACVAKDEEACTAEARLRAARSAR